MKIDTELTREEEDALLMILGYGTGMAIEEFRDLTLAKTCVRLTNKLLAAHPHFTPIDENSYDGKKFMPFTKVKPQ